MKIHLTTSQRPHGRHKRLMPHTCRLIRCLRSEDCTSQHLDTEGMCFSNDSNGLQCRERTEEEPADLEKLGVAHSGPDICSRVTLRRLSVRPACSRSGCSQRCWPKRSRSFAVSHLPQEVVCVGMNCPPRWPGVDCGQHCRRLRIYPERDCGRQVPG